MRSGSDGRFLNKFLIIAETCSVELPGQRPGLVRQSIPTTGVYVIQCGKYGDGVDGTSRKSPSGEFLLRAKSRANVQSWKPISQSF